MDRYDVVYSRHFHGSGIGKKENGAYVLYEDCKLRVGALSELLKNAEREAEEFREKCVELERENAEMKKKCAWETLAISKKQYDKISADAIREYEDYLCDDDGTNKLSAYEYADEQEKDDG